jgi:hypothetical protein
MFNIFFLLLRSSDKIKDIISKWNIEALGYIEIDQMNVDNKYICFNKIFFVIFQNTNITYILHLCIKLSMKTRFASLRI